MHVVARACTYARTHALTHARTHDGTHSLSLCRPAYQTALQATTARANEPGRPPASAAPSAQRLPQPPKASQQLTARSVPELSAEDKSSGKKASKAEGGAAVAGGHTKMPMLTRLFGIKPRPTSARAPPADSGVCPAVPRMPGLCSRCPIPRLLAGRSGGGGGGGGGDGGIV